MNTGVFKFFNQIFTKKKRNEPSIKFGKYSDRNKTVEQLQFWKNSLILFNDKKYFQALENFFKYIKDSEVDNLFFELKGDKIHFNFFQGSKQIFGTANNNIIIAYSEISKFSEPNENILKYILSTNHNLKFSKFIIDKTGILKIETLLKTSQCTPITLYSALREIAIIADKYDDLLANKFLNCEPINVGHIQQLPEEEIAVKIYYYHQWINETLELIKKYDAIKYAGARSFILLRLIYKLHFLLSPEGELLLEINKIHNIFNSSNNKTDFERNAKILRNIEKLANWSDSKIKKTLYFVYFTFPVVPPVEPKNIIDFAKDEINKTHWYSDNGHKEIATIITEYIVGYICFNFGSMPVIKEILDVFWQILHHEYYTKLNFKNIPITKGKIDYMLLNQIFNEINSLSQKNFRNFNFNIKHLNIANFDEFATSYIYEFINLDFTLTS